MKNFDVIFYPLITDHFQSYLILESNSTGNGS